jgi:hypothetical protein
MSFWSKFVNWVNGDSYRVQFENMLVEEEARVQEQPKEEKPVAKEKKPAKAAAKPAAAKKPAAKAAAKKAPAKTKKK